MEPRTENEDPVQALRQIGMLLDGYEHGVIEMDAARYQSLVKAAGSLIEKVGDSSQGVAAILGYPSLKELVYGAKSSRKEATALLARFQLGGKAG